MIFNIVLIRFMATALFYQGAPGPRKPQVIGYWGENVLVVVDLVYKIPYRRARAWPSGRAKVSCIQLLIPLQKQRLKNLLFGSFVSAKC